jgi:hypothetical protein
MSLLRLWARYVPLALGALTLAAMGCTPTIETESMAVGTGGGSPCAPQQAASDAAENCHRYCRIYDCLGCPTTTAECEDRCDDIEGNPTQTSADQACFACAVEHVYDLTSLLACKDDFTITDADGNPLFPFNYRPTDCPMCKE